MPAYRLTPGAQADLIEIRRFTLHRWGLAQSQKYLAGLRHIFKLLAKTPTLGKARPEVGSSVLSFPYESHMVYYLVHEQQLVVFGVLHKRMVPLNHLAKRAMI